MVGLFPTLAITLAVLSVNASPQAGSYSGLAYTTSVDLFAGIQYAEHPTGTLRFAPAQQLPPASAPVDATDYGNACIQFGSRSDFVVEASSEECLFLNVFRPAAAGSTANLPVAVWIHGGSHRTGSGGPAYNATALTREPRHRGCNHQLQAW